MKVTLVTNLFSLAVFLLAFVAEPAESQTFLCSARAIGVVVLSESGLVKDSIIATSVSSFSKTDGSCPAGFLGLTNNSLKIENVFNFDDIPRAKDTDIIECFYKLICEDQDELVARIIIQDENDELPVFTNAAPTQINVNEIWGVGQDVYNFATSVSDPDFEDTPNDNKLQLLINSSTPETNVFDVSGNLGIKLLRSLDYEDPDRRRYVLTLQLKDQAGNFGPLHLLTINIDDGDDQPPVFTNTSYVLSVRQEDLKLLWCYETHPKISASDGDLAINAPIDYSLKGSDFFDMNCLSPGEIRLVRPYREDSPLVFNFDVQASQRNVMDRRSTSSVYIEVLRRPILSQRAYFASISENSPAGSVVLVVHTDYSSELPVRDTEFQVNDTTYFQLVKIGKNVAQLEIKEGVVLDYEITNYHVLALHAIADNMTSESSIITVLINDTNDNYPTFEEPVYSVTVDEGEIDPEKWQLRIVAEDKDSGPSGFVQYTLEKECGFFELLPQKANNKLTFEVIVQAKMDLRGDNSIATRAADGTAQYACDLIAQDNGSPKLSSRVKILANVRDINDKKPVFSYGASHSAQLVIGSTSGILVACISATDGDQPGTNNSIVRFSLTENDELEIDEENGQIRTKKPIGGVSRKVNFSITAFDLGNPSLSDVMSLEVEFVDAVLVPFRFDRLSYENEIQENADAGSVVVIVKAEVNGTTQPSTSYSLADNLLPFMIISETGEVKVKPETILDRETRNVWTFVVTATDISLPGRTAYTTVNINIKDVNDNPPQFIRSNTGEDRFETILVEGSPSGTLVACFYATDIDESHTPNSAVNYSLAGNNASLFSINQHTGEIILETSIDRPQEISLQVTASDNGIPMQSAVATLTVKVVQAALITLDFERQQYVSSISENANDGLPVITVTAEVNGAFSPSTRYSIPDSSLPYDIHPITGVIFAKGRLDRERQSSWTFSVAAVDEKVRGRTAFTLVFVNITDMNDNEPIFAGLRDGTPDHFESRIVEGSPEGALVACAYAVDNDEAGSQNALIVYSLEGSDVDHFSVDQATGEIKLAKTFASPQTVEINVTASDRGSPRLSKTAVLVVRVVGAPLVTFEFEKEHYESTAVENSVNGLTVATVKALVNGLESSSIEYSIPDKAIPFEVDSRNGDVKVNGDIDREAKSVWTFRVAAVDSNLRGRTAFSLVVINITDINDNTPKFVGLQETSSDRFESTLVEGSPAGTLVACMYATDDDEKGSLNADVEYSIEGSESGRFVVEKTTGEVKLANIIGSPQTVEINVTASDRGSPRLSKTAVLVVRVVGAPLVTFEFEKEHYESTAVENSVNGLTVATVKALVNGLESSSIEYSIPDKAIPFEVDSRNGDVKVNGDIDREAKSVWTFRVAAVDSNLRGRTAFSLVTIVTLDENDNSPVFRGTTNLMFRSMTSDSAKVGTLVACTYAYDADEPNTNNSLVHYSLLGSEFFDIDPSSGQVSVSASLKRAPVTVMVEVIAFDHGRPQRNATATLIVTVEKTDVTEILFEEMHYNANLTEAIVTGDNLVIVTALVNGSASGTTVYSTPDAHLPFTVNQSTGSVTLSNKQKAFSKDFWSFLVIATDPLASQFTAFTLVNVQVLSALPVFVESSYYHASLSEAAEPPANVIIIKARSSGGRPVVYKLVSQAPALPFEIDNNSGQLRSTAKLDREKIPSYQFNVLAKYADSNEDWNSPYFSESRVRIDVTDINDNPPQFGSDKKQLVLEAGAGSGVVLGTVQATDADECVNIIYKLSPNGNNFFSINNASGEITLRSSGYIPAPSFTFTVTAQDYCGANSSGQPVYENFQVIEVNVANIPTSNISMDCFDWKNKAQVQELQRKISQIIKLNVVIYDFRPSVSSGDACMQASIYAVSEKDNSLVQMENLRAALENRKQDIENEVGGQQRETSDVTEKNLIINMVAGLAAVLGVICIALTAVICKRRYPKPSPAIEENDTMTPHASIERESAPPRSVAGATAVSSSGFTGSNGVAGTSKGTGSLRNGSAAPPRDQPLPPISPPSSQPLDDTTVGASAPDGLPQVQKTQAAAVSPAAPSRDAQPLDTSTVPQIIIQAPDAGSISGHNEATRIATDNAEAQSPSSLDASSSAISPPNVSDVAQALRPILNDKPTIHDSVAIEMDGRNGEQANGSEVTENDSDEELSAL